MARGDKEIKVHRKTIVSHSGIVDFWKKSPEERRAFMRGTGGPKAQRKAKAIMRKQTQEFIKERDAVLRALDLTGMIVFYQKNKKPLPLTWADPTVPYAMMHKARLQIETFTEEEKELSRNWLTLNGYHHDLFHVEDNMKQGETAEDARKRREERMRTDQTGAPAGSNQVFLTDPAPGQPLGQPGQPGYVPPAQPVPTPAPKPAAAPSPDAGPASDAGSGDGGGGGGGGE